MPYTEEDEAVFFGREKDARLIVANLFAAPLTLLYGASGVGKTSIIRAGVINRLRQRDDVVVILFNSWQIDPISALKGAIINALSNVAGASVPMPDSASLAEYLTTSASRLQRRWMIILDQFDEYFLYHHRADAFAAEFPEAVTRADIPVSFLISIREDALAKLDRFEGRIPNLFDSYLRLDHLDRRAATEAIVKPLEYYNKHMVESGKQIEIDRTMVNTIIDQVSTGKVTIGEVGRGRIASSEQTEVQIETPYLQLVMTRLWEEEMKAGSHIIVQKTLYRLGGAEGIVRTHLGSAMKKLSANERNIAASIFNYLVTPSGTKIALAAEDLANFATELTQTPIARLLEKLSKEDFRILRPAERADGMRGRAVEQDQSRYEIYHDALAKPILDWRTRYLQEQAEVKGGRRAKWLWILAVIIALAAGLLFGVMSYRHNWGNARISYLAGKSADPMDVIDWLLDKQVFGNIDLGDVNSTGTKRALVALGFAYELDPQSRQTTEFLERLLREIRIRTRPQDASLQALQNGVMILEEMHKNVPYSPLLAEVDSLKGRVILKQLDEQSQLATVSDTTLLRGYRNLLGAYSQYIDTVNVKQQIITLQVSVARFAKQLASQASDTLTINQKLVSWKDFAKSQRDSPEKNHADRQIQQLDSLMSNSATIATEDDFVTCRNVVDRMPQGISNRFSPGTIWAWARVRAPRTEKVTFRWYTKNELYHTYQLVVSQSGSFRTYTARNYGVDLAGKNEVRLYNSQNILIGRRTFFVR